MPRLRLSVRVAPRTLSRKRQLLHFLELEVFELDEEELGLQADVTARDRAIVPGARRGPIDGDADSLPFAGDVVGIPFARGLCVLGAVPLADHFRSRPLDI